MIRTLLPADPPHARWKSLTPAGRDDLFAAVYDHLTESEDRQSAFLKSESRLSAAFTLVKHLHSTDELVEGSSWRDVIDEVEFLQAARRQVFKQVRSAEKPSAALDSQVRALVDDAVEAEGVVDIYAAAGIERPDLSIIDDAFLQTFKHRTRPNLRVRLLARLLEDEIDRVERNNLAKARSFKELLEKTLEAYHSRVIDAAMVVQRIAEMHREIDGDARRAKLLGLTADEVAFYDAVAQLAPTIYDQPFLCELVHEVVQAVKRHVRPDWTQPHRSDVRAAVRVAVRTVLRRRGLREEDFEPFLDRLFAQAEAKFRDWPVAA